MEIKVERITDWKLALNAARFTQRKGDLDKEPSTNFKRNLIKAEHSPLRCVQYMISMYDIPYYTSVHFVRHVHAQPFCSTSRPDIDGNQLPREEQKKSDLVNLRLMISAEEILNISRKRLCYKAEKETRDVWVEVLCKLADIDPELVEACVPNCIYRGNCPEFDCCGFIKSNKGLTLKSIYNEGLWGTN